MKTFQNISLQRKQTLIIMLTSGVALLVACIIFVSYDVVTFRRAMVTNLSTLAEIVGNNSSAALDFDDPKSAVEILSALRVEPNIETGCIYAKDGSVFAVYDREDNETEILPPAAKQNGHYFENNSLHLFRQIIHNDEVVGTVYVESDLNVLNSRLQRYAAIVAGVFLAALFVAFFLSGLLQKLVSGPILHLVQTARAIAQKQNYSMRAEKQSEDELGMLVESFNEMLEQIQLRDAELQRSKDALEQRVEKRTHELATSLSLIHATLESTADGILVANGKGNVTNFNEQFIRMWKIPREIADSGDERRMLDVALSQLKDPEQFLAKVKELYGRPDVESFDVLEFKDGRVFERYSKPQQIADKSKGRVWSFRDVTERKQAEVSAMALSKLSHDLSSAASAEEASQIISRASDDLLGWDAFWVQLYSEKEDTIFSVLDIDTIDGKRVRSAMEDPRKSTEMHHRILSTGGELILRDQPASFLPGAYPYGDTSRPSASIMLVPIRYGNRRVGILSIQSYTAKAYDKQDLNLLQTLADQCAGALERIWADEALRKSESRLRQIEELYRRAIAGADAVPYSYDYIKRSYVFMGEGIEQLIGYAPREVSGELWKRIVQESVMAGETAGLDKEEAARRVTTGEIRNWRCDMRVITREGKSRWISDVSVQNLDEFGRPIGSMGILQDITERKQTEISALAFSKLGQNLSSAASPEQAARIIGEVADDLLGWDACHVQLYSAEDDKIHSILNVDTIDNVKVENTPSPLRSSTEMHRRILNEGPELILRQEANSFLPGGTPFGNTSRPSASLMFVPIRYRSRSIGILSIQSYSRNVYDEQSLRTLQTMADHCGGALERIRADEALRKSELQFRLVWDTSAEGMRLTDTDGIVLMANDAYCRMIEKTKSEVEGKYLSLIHCREKQDSILQKHRKEIAARSFSQHVEKEVTLWNGKKIWFGLSNSVLELPGQPPLLLSVFRDITERKKAEADLEAMHRQLLDASRQAGMADVATNVLHNVGNVLNSVNVSGSLIRERIKKSKVSNLGKIVAIFEEHSGGLPDFFASDPKGKQLPGYLSQLAAHLANEREEVVNEISSLVKNIEHIKEIVAMQQSYAKVSGMSESLQVVDLVEDALRLNAGALERHRVQVIREYTEAPPIQVEKHKVLQILVNLIRNAKYACDDANGPDKHIRVRITNENNHLSVAVIDNGIGIPPENLTRIFNHGFTTRKGGHGFGLHSGALAATEIGGSLNVHSDGLGKGAAFILKLPVNN